MGAMAARARSKRAGNGCAGTELLIAPIRAAAGIVLRLAVRETGLIDNFSSQERVRVVDARIHDRDHRTAAVESLRVREVRLDLWDAVGERGCDQEILGDLCDVAG